MDDARALAGPARAAAGRVVSRGVGSVRVYVELANEDLYRNVTYASVRS